MSLITFSPSSLAQYRDCPLKFYGQRSKMIQWKDSPQKARGTAVHASLEKAVRDGVEAVPSWPEGMNTAYTLTTIQRLRRTAAEGATLCTEHEMAVTTEFKPCGWWDGDALLRAKADLLLVAPQQYALLGDWKTGRIYDGMDMQLRTEALLVHVLYQVPKVNWALFYVDQGQTKAGEVDFTQGLGQVQDILTLMKNCKKVVEHGGPFIPKQNKFCKWCDWYHSEYCTASYKW